MSDDEGNLEEIPWVPIVVGQGDPNVFNNRKWTSESGELYPIDIVLGLKYLCNVYKVVVDVDPELVPSKIEVSVGKGEPDCGNDVESAKSADYGTKGSLVFKIRERSNSRMEGRTLFADHVGHFVWLVVYKPLPISKNPNKLVGIRKVTILGYPVEKDRPRRAPSKSKSRGMQRERTPSASRLSTASPARMPTPAGTPTVPPEYMVNREGDGMHTGGDNLAGDPLTTIRTVQRALREKIEVSKQEGKDVEATVCLRAIQRLEEYEVRLEDMASRRSKALTVGDMQAAERLNLMMTDSRDTVLRAIHVDLLLNRAELRSIGVGSRWKETPESY